jgi:hypothetical protein
VVLGFLPKPRKQPAAFKIGKKQFSEGNTWTTHLRRKAEALNIAIVVFNQAIGPLSQAVGDAFEDSHPGKGADSCRHHNRGNSGGIRCEI